MLEENGLYTAVFNIFINCGLSLILFLTLTLSAFALENGQTSPPENIQTSVAPVFDPDAPPETRTKLAPFLTFGGQVELEPELEKNFDLDNSDDEDESKNNAELSLAFSFDPTEKFRAYLSVGLLGELDLEEEEKAERRVSFGLGQTYLLLKDLPVRLGSLQLDGLFSFQVGRQRIEDDREWMVDEELDAIRVFYRLSRFSLALSASRSELVDVNSDLLNNMDSAPGERINNYIVFGSYEMDEEVEIGEIEVEEVEFTVYGFIRDDRSGDQEDLTFLGFHLGGEIEIVDDIEYWLELAHVWGDDGSRDFRGIGLDVGSTYKSGLPLEPSVSIGYAFGSKNFRQTGIQDNSDKFNGVTSFKYYGELLDPELSNLSILTTGIGIRPTEESSVDLVYHYYLQNEASESLRNVEINAEPTGLSKGLGSEIDLILGYEEIEDVDLALALGYLIPGKAFPDPADNSFFAGLEIQFSF